MFLRRDVVCDLSCGGIVKGRKSGRERKGIEENIEGGRGRKERKSKGIKVFEL